MHIGNPGPVSDANLRDLYGAIVCRKVLHVDAARSLMQHWINAGIVVQPVGAPSEAPRKVVLQKIREAWGQFCLVFVNSRHTHCTCAVYCEESNCPHIYVAEQLAGKSKGRGHMLPVAKAPRAEEASNRPCDGGGSSAEEGASAKRKREPKSKAKAKAKCKAEAKKIKSKAMAAREKSKGSSSSSSSSSNSSDSD